MLSKRKEYHVDCLAAKGAKFFLMCKSHINPDMRIKISAAMMANGYSDKESKNRTRQMQVRREVEKIRGLDPPRPSEAVAAAATALLTLLAHLNMTRVTLATITPNVPLALAESAGGWYGGSVLWTQKIDKNSTFGGGVIHSQIA
jgi:hypothetical protein